MGVVGFKPWPFVPGNQPPYPLKKSQSTFLDINIGWEWSVSSPGHSSLANSLLTHSKRVSLDSVGYRVISWNSRILTLSSPAHIPLLYWAVPGSHGYDILIQCHTFFWKFLYFLNRRRKENINKQLTSMMSHRSKWILYHRHNTFKS
jgi:hypothetical protein